MALSVDQACDLIKNVFPELEKSSIAYMLQQNKYHVERTIEAILARGDQTPPPQVQQMSPPAQSIPPGHTTNQYPGMQPMNQNPAMQPTPSYQQPMNTYQQPLSSQSLDSKSYLIRKPTLGANQELSTMFKTRRGKPIELAGDFLRAPRSQSNAGPVNRDEEFARLLQDQEFRNSLQAEVDGHQGAGHGQYRTSRPNNVAQVQYLPRNEIPNGFVLYNIDSADGLDPPRVIAFPPTVRPSSMHPGAHMTRLGVIGEDIIITKDGFHYVKGAKPPRQQPVASGAGDMSNTTNTSEVPEDGGNGMFGSFKTHVSDFISRFKSDQGGGTSASAQPPSSGYSPMTHGNTDQVSNRPLLQQSSSGDEGARSDGNSIQLQSMIRSTETASGAKKYTFQDDDDDDDRQTTRIPDSTSANENAAKAKQPSPML